MIVRDSLPDHGVAASSCSWGWSRAAASAARTHNPRYAVSARRAPGHGLARDGAYDGGHQQQDQQAFAGRDQGGGHDGRSAPALGAGQRTHPAPAVELPHRKQIEQVQPRGGARLITPERRGRRGPDAVGHEGRGQAPHRAGQTDARVLVRIGGVLFLSGTQTQTPRPGMNIFGAVARMASCRSAATCPISRSPSPAAVPLRKPPAPRGPIDTERASRTASWPWSGRAAAA